MEEGEASQGIPGGLLLRCEISTAQGEDSAGLCVVESEDETGSRAVVVEQLTRGGAAHRAGLRVHDQVISIGGQELGDDVDLRRLLASVEPRLHTSGVAWVVRRVPALVNAVGSPASTISEAPGGSERGDMRPLATSLELAWYQKAAEAAKLELTRCIADNAKQTQAAQQHHGVEMSRLLAAVAIAKRWREHRDRSARRDIRAALAQTLLQVRRNASTSIHTVPVLNGTC